MLALVAIFVAGCIVAVVAYVVNAPSIESGSIGSPRRSTCRTRRSPP
jgi:hypothetical protein